MSRHGQQRPCDDWKCKRCGSDCSSKRFPEQASGSTTRTSASPGGSLGTSCAILYPGSAWAHPAPEAPASRTCNPAGRACKTVRSQAGAWGRAVRSCAPALPGHTLPRGSCLTNLQPGRQSPQDSAFPGGSLGTSRAILYPGSAWAHPAPEAPASRTCNPAGRACKTVRSQAGAWGRAVRSCTPAQPGHTLPRGSRLTNLQLGRQSPQDSAFPGGSLGTNRAIVCPGSAWAHPAPRLLPHEPATRQAEPALGLLGRRREPPRQCVPRREPGDKTGQHQL
ncbi:hypothetical protein RISK_000664 [Rhodopirellula islandica]|uniref:Uncharacterized protein n=1 Tax=Rhodopirellula islandica TaxID=595434 RepID=A0A0J1BM25_RHOIS|nr:hypothetical protein RISK_000664 [Rhodopirellula islandica]